MNNGGFTAGEGGQRLAQPQQLLRLHRTHRYHAKPTAHQPPPIITVQRGGVRPRQTGGRADYFPSQGMTGPYLGQQISSSCRLRVVLQTGQLLGDHCSLPIDIGLGEIRADEQLEERDEPAGAEEGADPLAGDPKGRILPQPTRPHSRSRALDGLGAGTTEGIPIAGP